MRKQGHISDLDSLFREGVLKTLYSYLPEHHHIFYVLNNDGKGNIDIIFYLEAVHTVEGNKPESIYNFEEMNLVDISLGSIIGFIATIEYIDKKLEKLIDTVDKDSSDEYIKMAESCLGESLLAMEIISFDSFRNLKGIGSFLLVLFIEFAHTLSNIYKDTISTILKSKSDFSQDDFHSFIKEFGPYQLKTLSTEKGISALNQFLLKKDNNGFREEIESGGEIILEEFIPPLSKFLLDDDTGRVREPNNIYMKYGFEYRYDFDCAMIGDISRIQENALKIFTKRYTKASFLDLIVSPKSKKNKGRIMLPRRVKDTGYRFKTPKKSLKFKKKITKKNKEDT